MRFSIFTLLFFSFMLFFATRCEASLVGWILGRDSSPFNILNSEKQFDKLMTQTKTAEPPNNAQDDDTSLSASAVPFELSVADEKFIADAQKYTDLALSELDLCQHRVFGFDFNTQSFFNNVLSL